MAPVVTKDVSTVTLQQLHDIGINPYAVELLVESYASPTRCGDSQPTGLTFIWRGVRVHLKAADPEELEPMWRARRREPPQFDPAWEQIACPFARSSMTPCVVRHGNSARADDGACVGCGHDDVHPGVPPTLERADPEERLQ